MWRLASPLLLMLLIVPAATRGSSADEPSAGCVPPGWSATESEGRTRIDGGSAHLVVAVRRPGQESARSVIDRFAADVQSAARAEGVDLSRDRSAFRGDRLAGGLIAIPSGRDLVLAGGWAPAGSWAAVEPRMEAVARCYGE